MPMPTDPQGGDHYNTQGYIIQPEKLPVNSDFGVLRLDHDINDRNHFFISDRWHYSSLHSQTSSQVDIGGALPGDTFGQAADNAPRPSIRQLSGRRPDQRTLKSNLVNDFRFNVIRNYWSWSDQGGTPQLPGLGGAVEIGGESSNALIPYNVDTSSTRQRAWDGHDQFYRDDVNLLHRNHQFQFGASYQRDFDYYTRNDNGIATDSSLTYQIGQGTGITFPAADLPAGLPSSQLSNYSNLYGEVLGIVSQSQVMYTRSGPNLTLNPTGDPISIHAIVPSYNEYFSDTWHVRPSFTLTYGLGYNIEMPPYELQGKQVQFVDSADQPISLASYLQQKQKAALAGQVYDPTIGFATTPNVAGGGKYPFHPFYGEFSPRASRRRGIRGSIPASLATFWAAAKPSSVEATRAFTVG